MSGYVPNAPKGYRNKGVEPVDLGAQRWAQYPDLLPKAEAKPQTAGCTFTKPCKLPDGVINYASSAIPTNAISEYGQLVLLGGREADATGKIPLQQISGHALPAALGTLLLGGVAATAGAATGVGTGAGAGVSTGTAATGASAGTTFFTTGVIAGGLAGIAALLWPSSLGDSSLYTPEQLKALKEGRTRVRLHIEQQADGTLKGYGYNTEKRSDWEMIPVARFEAQGSQQVADFGDGITLTWTPAIDPSSASGIPPLEAAPQAPHIWIYPPTEQADSIIVNPLYPPDYKDFILVFPPGSGIQPLYIVFNIQLEKNRKQGKAFEDAKYDELSQTQPELGREVTIKAKSGARTRLDMLGRDADGKLSCIECKSSDTAPLTKNQKVAFPEIQESGAIVVGKGKPGFPGGTEIPPTKVEIIRPKP
ncbi:S-type pyocin domain-containing protein [Pseudomonas chlororaphis]|uniref:S-type pyocin domain-containing protein n=1 Tax=Pseudomonas chlororaphis TaxID=587753 RepID=UPI002368DA48|nr:S-type pyocin domain-containing protein [Pseudomonas chlororaphis]WDH55631.1 S-type pyocin domain-containing protein [Pseudomonas chlororaphis]